MSLAVGISLDSVRIPLARSRVAEIAKTVLRSERVRDAMLSITFVTNRSIRAMNREHLNRDGLTDVIAFGFRQGAPTSAIVGDVYIAPDVARGSARSHDVTVREELTRLVIHGVLHVLGHDHPDDDRRVGSAMWKKQERLVRALAPGRP
jgi:probable rRNA maturation factor